LDDQGDSCAVEITARICHDGPAGNPEGREYPIQALKAELKKCDGQAAAESLVRKLVKARIAERARRR
jgi:hypothetical protein